MKITLALLGLAAAASAYPMFLLEEEPPSEVLFRQARQMADFPRAPIRRDSQEADLQTAADTAYGGAPVGRVKIQVYRGPSKGEGYDVFAPWGYYNTQPANLATYGLVWCNWSHFLSLLVVSRFRFIVDPAKENMTSLLGVITTLNPPI